MRCLIEEGEKNSGKAVSLVMQENEHDPGDDWRAFINVGGRTSVGNMQFNLIKDPINGEEYLIAYGKTAADAISNLEIFLQRWY